MNTTIYIIANVIDFITYENDVSVIRLDNINWYSYSIIWLDLMLNNDETPIMTIWAAITNGMDTALNAAVFLNKNAIHTNRLIIPHIIGSCTKVYFVIFSIPDENFAPFINLLNIYVP